MTVATEEMVSVDVWCGDDRYRLSFPLSELANAIALCGWTMTNDLVLTPDVEKELAFLTGANYLDIPDGREWFAKYGKRI